MGRTLRFGFRLLLVGDGAQHQWRGRIGERLETISFQILYPERSQNLWQRALVSGKHNGMPCRRRRVKRQRNDLRCVVAVNDNAKGAVELNVLVDFADDDLAVCADGH